MTEVLIVANSAALAVKINRDVKVSGGVFHLSFSCELAKATARHCQAISALGCRRVDSVWISRHRTGGQILCSVELRSCTQAGNWPLGANLVLQPFSFFNLGLEILCQLLSSKHFSVHSLFIWTLQIQRQEKSPRFK